MDVRTYRARSLRDALRLVEQELGPQATVLSTERAAAGILRRFLGTTEVEVVAMADARGTREKAGPGESVEGPEPTTRTAAPPIDEYRTRMRQFAVNEQSDSFLEAMIERSRRVDTARPSTALFQLHTDLVSQDVDDQFAEDFLAELRQQLTPSCLEDALQVRRHAVRLMSERIRTLTPLEHQTHSRRVVALIGPTGVGKTTTIAKLAANLRLREKRNVGLITVDTYRIAAVDQLRAYADIIDLPMEVVTTPREMRDAVLKLADLDLVLIDTAGRSHHDEVQIQELRAMLQEARADEVHLVLSGVSHARHLARVVQHFRPASPTALLITKLDETITYGHLLPLFVDAGLPLSYTTHGQNVPDDIQPANPRHLLENLLRGSHSLTPSSIESAASA